MKTTFNEDFVAKYKSSFTEQVLATAFESVQSLSGKALVNLTPCKQLNFFVLKDLFTQWQAEMKALESPYFNFKAPEVRKSMTQFMNTLSRHIEVEQEALGPLVENALGDCFLIATDPAEFIKKELADRKSQEYSAKHVKPLLKYIKVLNEEFDDFFEGQAKGEYEEVFEIATDYFADVDITPAQDSIFSELSQVEAIELSDLLLADELEDVIAFEEEDLEESDELVEASSSQQVYQESAPISSEDDTVPDQDDVEESITTEVEETLEEEEVEDNAMTEVDPAEEDQEPETMDVEESEDTSEILNDQFKDKTEQTVADHLEETQEVEGMLASISLNQRYMFAQELYGGDANAFQTSINTIDGIGSFDDAVEHLVTNYAKKFDWDMNSDEVKELLKIIFRKFR